jgi:hypothetical protein
VVSWAFFFNSTTWIWFVQMASVRSPSFAVPDLSSNTSTMCHMPNCGDFSRPKITIPFHDVSNNRDKGRHVSLVPCSLRLCDSKSVTCKRQILLLVYNALLDRKQNTQIRSELSNCTTTNVVDQKPRPCPREKHVCNW